MVALIFFWKAQVTTWESIWIYRWVLFQACLAVGVGGAFMLRGAYALGLAVTYFTVHTLIYYSGVIDLSIPPLIQGLRMNEAAQFPLLLFPLALLLFPRFPRWPFFATGGILALGIFFSDRREDWAPFQHNPSIIATYLACLAPFLPFTPLGFGILSVFLTAILLTKTSTAIAVLVVGLGWKYIVEPRRWRWALLFTPLLLTWPWIAPKLFTMEGHGRFPLWRLNWEYYSASDVWVRVFGLGFGSTPILSPLLQMTHGLDPKANTYYMYLHNEWLQVLFNGGVVGLGILLYFYVEVFARSRHRGAVLAYGVAMTTNFPWHIPLFALFGMMLVSEAYDFQRDRRASGP